MNSKYKDSDHFKARCWESAISYLQALDKEHITRMIEHSINKHYGHTEES